MIYKHFQPRTEDILELERLLKIPGITAQQRKDIETEIKKIKAGDKAEAETAYELDFHFGEGKKNVAVIHGLRLEVDGRVAQIDHLIIGRVLDLHVIESKAFGGGVAINEHGEFCTFWNNKPIAIGSPIAQVKKHVSVIRDAYKQGQFMMMKRMGIRLPLTFRTIIAVGKGARISRPEEGYVGVDRIVKNDHIRDVILRDDAEINLTDRNPLFEAGKIIGQDTLAEFAKSIAAAHKPADFDWATRFGISNNADAASKASTPAAASCAVCSQVLEDKEVAWCQKRSEQFAGHLLCRVHQKDNSEWPGVIGAPEVSEEAAAKASKKNTCDECGVGLHWTVVRFCRSPAMKKKFGDRLLCREHQG